MGYSDGNYLLDFKLFALLAAHPTSADILCTESLADHTRHCLAVKSLCGVSSSDLKCQVLQIDQRKTQACVRGYRIYHSSTLGSRLDKVACVQ